MALCLKLLEYASTRDLALSLLFRYCKCPVHLVLLGVNVFCFFETNYIHEDLMKELMEPFDCWKYIAFRELVFSVLV